MDATSLPEAPAVAGADPARRFWGNPWIGTLLRLALAGVLGAAGLIKLTEDGLTRREAILAYRIPGMTGQLADVLGWILPSVEVLLAVLLLVGLFTRWAALASGLLMALFIAGIASVWIRGFSIDCGCFGGGGSISSEGRELRYAAEILRDLLFLGMATWLVAWPGTRLSLDRSAG